MDVDAVQTKRPNKCYNCGSEDGHFVKDCPKPKIQCPECKFMGGGHKKDCKKRSKGGSRQARAATSWDDDKSTETKGSEKKDTAQDKGKGRDFQKSIQGMNFEEARAWFTDYEALDKKKSGKA